MNGTGAPGVSSVRSLPQSWGKRPVCRWCSGTERGTTVTAISYLNATDTRGKKRKAVVDAVAATIILESYLAWRKNNPES